MAANIYTLGHTMTQFKIEILILVEPNPNWNHQETIRSTKYILWNSSNYIIVFQTVIINIPWRSEHTNKVDQLQSYPVISHIFVLKHIIIIAMEDGK